MGVSFLPPAAARSLRVCIAYGGTAVALTLLNKALFGSYNFSAYFTLLSLKLSLLLGVCLASRKLSSNPLGVPAYDERELRAAVPMALCFVANAVLGFAGLSLVSVPLFNCLRRLVPACILAYEFASAGKVADAGTHAAVGLIGVGAVLAATATAPVGEAAAAWWRGVGITLAANLATAASLVTTRSFSERATGRLATFAVLYYTSLIALPLAIVCALLTGEVDLLHRTAAEAPAALWLGVLLSSCMGLGLTYTMSLCTLLASPMATSVTGNLKDVLTTSVGWMAFGHFNATPQAVTGLVLSFSGAALFSWQGLRKAQRQGVEPAGGGAASAQAAGAAVGGGGGYERVPAAAPA